MAGIKAPILSIMTRLNTIQVSNQDKVTVNLPVRIWNNHLAFEKQEKLYAYPKPWAFLEIISPVNYEQMGVGFKNADIGVRIHLIHEFYDAQDGTMEQDLDVFDLRDQIVVKLSRFAPDACGNIKMVAESMDYDHPMLYHYILDFVCNFVDSKGSPWDTDAGELIDKAPPTDMDLTVNVVDSLPPYAGTPPENNIIHGTETNPYRIPKQK